MEQMASKMFRFLTDITTFIFKTFQIGLCWDMLLLKIYALSSFSASVSVSSIFWVASTCKNKSYMSCKITKKMKRVYVKLTFISLSCEAIFYPFFSFMSFLFPSFFLCNNSPLLI